MTSYVSDVLINEIYIPSMSLEVMVCRAGALWIQTPRFSLEVLKIAGKDRFSIFNLQSSKPSNQLLFTLVKRFNLVLGAYIID